MVCLLLLKQPLLMQARMANCVRLRLLAHGQHDVPCMQAARSRRGACGPTGHSLGLLAASCLTRQVLPMLWLGMAAPLPQPTIELWTRNAGARTSCGVVIASAYLCCSSCCPSDQSSRACARVAPDRPRRVRAVPRLEGPAAPGGNRWLTILRLCGAAQQGDAWPALARCLLACRYSAVCCGPHALQE